MDAQELRIGNWVKFRVNEIEYKYVKVVWIKPDKVCVMNQYPSAIVDIGRLEPIEFTEEILLNVAFEFNYHIEYTSCELKINNKIKFRTDDTIDYKMVYLQYGGIELHSVKHLHKLQNLYSELNNKELEINLFHI